MCVGTNPRRRHRAAYLAPSRTFVPVAIAHREEEEPHHEEDDEHDVLFGEQQQAQQQPLLPQQQQPQVEEAPRSSSSSVVNITHPHHTSTSKKKCTRFFYTTYHTLVDLLLLVVMMIVSCFCYEVECEIIKSPQQEPHRHRRRPSKSLLPSRRSHYGRVVLRHEAAALSTASPTVAQVEETLV